MDIDLFLEEILAADRARYELEHMQMTIYVDFEDDIPATTEARLDRHLTELAEEHAALESALDCILEEDDREAQQASFVVYFYWLL